MALSTFGPNNCVVQINGRTISDFGETDPPITESPVDPKSILRKGMGGRAIRLDRLNPGRNVTVALNPGGADSSYISGLMDSNADIVYTRTQLGTGEVIVLSEGIIENINEIGRGGMSPTDDIYAFVFNLVNIKMGGSN